MLDDQYESFNKGVGMQGLTPTGSPLGTTHHFIRDALCQSVCPRRLQCGVMQPGIVLVLIRARTNRHFSRAVDAICRIRRGRRDTSWTLRSVSCALRTIALLFA